MIGTFFFVLIRTTLHFKIPSQDVIIKEAEFRHLILSLIWSLSLLSLLHPFQLTSVIVTWSLIILALIISSLIYFMYLAVRLWFSQYFDHFSLQCSVINLCCHVKRVIFDHSSLILFFFFLLFFLYLSYGSTIDPTVCTGEFLPPLFVPFQHNEVHWQNLWCTRLLPLVFLPHCHSLHSSLCSSFSLPTLFCFVLFFFTCVCGLNNSKYF